MAKRGHEPSLRAQAALRQWLRDGRFAPGDRLSPAELGEELRLSATPVREALSRLAGEGLLVERRGEGFYAPRLGRADIADLFRLSLAGLLIALEPGRARVPAGAADAPEEDPVRATEALFGRWVGGAGSAALAGVFASTQARLAPVRRVEPEVIPDLAREALALAAVATAAARLEAVRAFHLRRIRLADEFEGRLARGSANIAGI